MNSWHGYPKVWNLGHPRVEEIFDGRVLVQEKYDGSQLSFGVFNGVLKTRSRGQKFEPEAADKLFQPAVETALRAFEKGLLPEGWTFRGEAFKGKKHNTLTYGRAPRGNFVLFDIEKGYCEFADPVTRGLTAYKIEVEPAQDLAQLTSVPGMSGLDAILNTESSLGGPKVEGIVFKNYQKFTQDGKVMMAKYVSESFREAHKLNPNFKKGSAFIVDTLGNEFATEQRWRKAIQRMRDAGDLEGSPRDIGPLLKDLNQDLEEEWSEVLKDLLWKHFRRDILRRSTKGFPEWYKRTLAEKALEEIG